jgi:hypothetical protein
MDDLSTAVINLDEVVSLILNASLFLLKMLAAVD